MLKTFKLIENAKEEEQEIYASALYIKEMYVPDYKTLEATGKVSFFKFTTLTDLDNYLRNNLHKKQHKIFHFKGHKRYK